MTTKLNKFFVFIFITMTFYSFSSDSYEDSLFNMYKAGFELSRFEFSLIQKKVQENKLKETSEKADRNLLEKADDLLQKSDDNLPKAIDLLEKSTRQNMETQIRLGQLYHKYAKSHFCSLSEKQDYFRKAYDCFIGAYSDLQTRVYLVELVAQGLHNGTPNKLEGINIGKKAIIDCKQALSQLEKSSPQRSNITRILTYIGYEVSLYCAELGKIQEAIFYLKGNRSKEAQELLLHLKISNKSHTREQGETTFSHLIFLLKKSSDISLPETEREKNKIAFALRIKGLFEEKKSKLNQNFSQYAHSEIHRLILAAAQGCSLSLIEENLYLEIEKCLYSHIVRFMSLLNRAQTFAKINFHKFSFPSLKLRSIQTDEKFDPDDILRLQEQRRVLTEGYLALSTAKLYGYQDLPGGGSPLIALYQNAFTDLEIHEKFYEDLISQLSKKSNSIEPIAEPKLISQSKLEVKPIPTSSSNKSPKEIKSSEVSKEPKNQEKDYSFQTEKKEIYRNYKLKISFLGRKLEKEFFGLENLLKKKRDELLEDISNCSWDTMGRGKPEVLKGIYKGYKGAISLQLSYKEGHRLVYYVLNKEEILILNVLGHY